MRSFLNAIQEGRLIELPDNDKEKALEYLALILEAVPDIGKSTAIVEKVREREDSANTGIGMGVACPHVTVEQDGDLLCAVGWTPKGIDYKSSDGKPVHLVIMYYIPESQRAVYLKEISGLAKALKATGGIKVIAEAKELTAVRHRLLDWVNLTIDSAIPDAKARMIKLDAKQAELIAQLRTLPAADGQGKYSIIPFTVVSGVGAKKIILSQNQELVERLEKSTMFADMLLKEESFEIENYKIAVRFSSDYALARKIVECVAFKDVSQEKE
ncbi:MAG: PTS sugar transporter subunit IIA [Candidatus Aminicenantes bacterium]|nr:PTS sugar transporter subunit IIA [Candidatus Aminicenantes bacterium]